MKIYRYVVSFVLVCCLSMQAQPAYEDAILAIVGQEVITAFDVRRETAFVEREMTSSLKGEDLQQKLILIRKKALEALIEQALIYADFSSRGAQVPEALVSERLNEIISKQAGGDRNRFEGMLTAQKSNLEEFEKALRKSLAVELMRDEFVRRRVRVNPSELLTYYRENPGQFTQAGRFRLQGIVITKKNRTQEEVGKKVAALEARLKAGDEFAELAKEFSDDRSGQNGGDLGWYDDKNPPRRDFAEAINSLSAGQTAAPLDRAEAVYILRVAEKQDAKTVSFADARNAIENHLFQVKSRQIESEWLDTLRNTYTVQIMK